MRVAVGEATQFGMRWEVPHLIPLFPPIAKPANPDPDPDPDPVPVPDPDPVPVPVPDPDPVPVPVPYPEPETVPETEPLTLLTLLTLTLTLALTCLSAGIPKKSLFYLFILFAGVPAFVWPW